jgi:mannitol-1-phosphate/altronate dehydrogenase
VNRITPVTTAEDRSLVAQARGFEDASPVPTEPFAEWVISGRFPAYVLPYLIGFFGEGHVCDHE